MSENETSWYTQFYNKNALMLINENEFKKYINHFNK